jgi:sulfhydrogenase subunit beta (sulfur reductase)
MARNSTKNGPVIIGRAGFQAFLDLLGKKGYQVIAPTVNEGALVYEHVTKVAQLPEGWSDVQAPGRYGLRRRNDGALFSYTVGQESWKRFLLPPRVTVWSGQREAMQGSVPDKEIPRYAFLGVRACEIKAILIQDKVMTQGPFVDDDYAARRRNILIVAVQCGLAGGTCFCASMNTGPAVTEGYDIVLTELLDDKGHRFVAEAGSKRGEEILREAPHQPGNSEDKEAAARVVAEAADNMGRSLETNDLRDILYKATEHPQWDDVAARCLSCANCTLVCPTCFCTTVEDHTDLYGQSAERIRRWDSCFTVDFSYIHGGSIRLSVRSRYRQWLTHKLAAWVDQFGTFGCVGCGRCITWCPVGIDITEEATAIRNRTITRGVHDGND